MTVLVVGLILFFGMHLVPSTPLRATLVERIGEDPFKGLFSLVSLAGFVLIVYGFSTTEFVALLDPQPWGRGVTYWAVPLAMVLLVASNTPNNIKRVLRHPMLIGLIIWSGAHVAANGDLASTVLFVSFGGFALLDIVLVEVQGRAKPAAAVSFIWDLVTVVIGLALAAVLFYFHEYISGMPLV